MPLWRGFPVRRSKGPPHRRCHDRGRRACSERHAGLDGIRPPPGKGGRGGAWLRLLYHAADIVARLSAVHIQGSGARCARSSRTAPSSCDGRRMAGTARVLLRVCNARSRSRLDDPSPFRPDRVGTADVRHTSSQGTSVAEHDQRLHMEVRGNRTIRSGRRPVMRISACFDMPVRGGSSTNMSPASRRSAVEDRRRRGWQSRSRHPPAAARRVRASRRRRRRTGCLFAEELRRAPNTSYSPNLPALHRAWSRTTAAADATRRSHPDRAARTYRCHDADGHAWCARRQRELPNAGGHTGDARRTGQSEPPATHRLDARVLRGPHGGVAAAGHAGGTVVPTTAGAAPGAPPHH